MIKKSKFYSKYKITDAKPLGLERHYIQVSNFSSTLIDFLSKEFTGLFEVDYEPIWETNATIKISEGHVAYFLKTLMATVFGRETLKLKMLLEDEVFNLSIEAESNLPMTNEEMINLVKLIHSTGFSHEITDNRILLYSAVRRAMKKTLHSLSTDLFRQRLVEIFFTGGPPVEL